ncbi:MAG: hypothetical protein HFE30_09900 [Clostridiales bacterium]|nr:hypothetical protein [Clostridiales bacterium]
MSPQTSFQQDTEAISLRGLRECFCGAQIGGSFWGAQPRKAFFMPLFFTKKRAKDGYARNCIPLHGSRQHKLKKLTREPNQTAFKFTAFLRTKSGTKNLTKLGFVIAATVSHPKKQQS